MKENTFHIHGSDSIRVIQDHFNHLFPSMQISFFLDPAKCKQSDQCILLSSQVKLYEINPVVNDLSIELNPKMRVTDLEKIIKSMGLHVQISCRIANRRSPDTSVSNWLLTDVYGVEMPKIVSTQPFS
jgi:hypothetical protein